MSGPRKPVGGIPSVIEMLQLMDPATRKKILFNISQKDPALARQIDAQLFSFEDFLSLSPKDTQTLLMQIAEATLLTALRSASDALKEHFFSNMSKRAATILRDELATASPKRLSEVQTAQADIIVIARRLEGEGKILLKK